jgi:hypothetical protein
MVTITGLHAAVRTSASSDPDDTEYSTKPCVLDSVRLYPQPPVSRRQSCPAPVLLLLCGVLQGPEPCDLPVGLDSLTGRDGDVSVVTQDNNYFTAISFGTCAGFVQGLWKLRLLRALRHVHYEVVPEQSGACTGRQQPLKAARLRRSATPSHAHSLTHKKPTHKSAI